MVDRNVVTARLAELADRIGYLRTRCPASADDLVTDRDTRDLVSFNLMLAVQTCLDLASHVIADEGWPPAVSLADSFHRLAEHRVISPTTARALARAAGLRNVVAHGYGRADFRLVHAGATSGLGDLETFAREVAAWVGVAQQSE